MIDLTHFELICFINSVQLSKLKWLQESENDIDSLECQVMFLARDEEQNVRILVLTHNPWYIESKNKEPIFFIKTLKIEGISLPP